MKKNQLVTTKSTSLILGKSKSLMGITKKILETKSKELTTHTGITVIGDLMWEKESRQMNWDDAMEYAKNLRLGGYDDWRLPTIEELKEVVVFCGGIPIGFNIEIRDKNRANKTYETNYKIKDFNLHSYWSSTNGTGTMFTWVKCVDFYNGYVHDNIKSINHYFRCVRQG